MATSAWTPPQSRQPHYHSVGGASPLNFNLDRLIVPGHAAFFDQTLHRRHIFLTHQDDGTSDDWKDLLLYIGLLLPFKPSSCSLPLSPLMCVYAFAFSSFHVCWLHLWCFLARAFQKILSVVLPPVVVPFQHLFGSVQPVAIQLNQALPAAQVHLHQTARGFPDDSTHAEAPVPLRVRTGVIGRQEGTLFPEKPDSLRGVLFEREERP